MLATSRAFSSFAVDDLDTARRFYSETLGLKTTVLDPENGVITIDHPDGRATLVYRKPDHAPAPFTVLNFPVADVDAAVEWLTGRGIELERYEGFDQDDNGIARGPGPAIAWFTDPAGNIFAVLEEA